MKLIQWDVEKLKKLFAQVLKMQQLECVLNVGQLVKYSSLAHLEKREENAKNAVKNLNYSSKIPSLLV